MDEQNPLRGNVLLHPSFVTPHEFPAFVRASICRVVGGSMLLSGTFTALCALTTTHVASRASCAISTSVSFVAFYHYVKLVAVREQTGSRVRLSKPGEVPFGQATELKVGWLDMAADAIRYSDWTVTLPVLVMEMHLLLTDAPQPIQPVWFGIPWACTLTGIMIFLGAYSRFGTDELVPIREDQRNSMVDGFARLSGLGAYIAACVCLFFILYNLLGNLNDANDPTNGWVFAFSMPWIGYGLVSFTAMATRQFVPDGYPEWLSVFKDMSYGVLDVWSKAIFGVWVGAKALALTDPIFVF